MNLRWYVPIFLITIVNSYAMNSVQRPIRVHTTQITGLHDNDRQLIRTDLVVTKDGVIIETGFQSGCEGNGDAIYEAIFWPGVGVHHYQYQLAYSLCDHQEDTTLLEHHCTPLEEIMVLVDTKDNDFVVNVPQYALNLSAYAHHASPCQDEEYEIDELSVLHKKKFKTLK